MRHPTVEDRIHGVRVRIPLETRLNDFTRVMNAEGSDLVLYSQKAAGTVAEILRVPLRMVPVGLSVDYMACCAERTERGCNIHDWYRVDLATSPQVDWDPDGWWFAHKLMRVEAPEIVAAVEFLLTPSAGHYSAIPREYFGRVAESFYSFASPDRKARRLDSRETFVTKISWTREQLRKLASPDCVICLGTGVIEHVEPKPCDCCWRNA